MYCIYVVYAAIINQQNDKELFSLYRAIHKLFTDRYRSPSYVLEYKYCRKYKSFSSKSFS